MANILYLTLLAKIKKNKSSPTEKKALVLEYKGPFQDLPYPGKLIRQT
jgi:hypothetical protein